MPTLLTSIFDALAAATGWVFHVSCGGPNPSDNGAIYHDRQVLTHATLDANLLIIIPSSYYFGRDSPAGNDFFSAYLGYEEGFQKPFIKHLKNCFRE